MDFKLTLVLLAIIGCGGDQVDNTDYQESQEPDPIPVIIQDPVPVIQLVHDGFLYTEEHTGRQVHGYHLQSDIPMENNTFIFIFVASLRDDLPTRPNNRRFILIHAGNTQSQLYHAQQGYRITIAPAERRKHYLPTFVSTHPEYLGRLYSLDFENDDLTKNAHSLLIGYPFNPYEVGEPSLIFF